MTHWREQMSHAQDKLLPTGSTPSLTIPSHGHWRGNNWPASLGLNRGQASPNPPPRTNHTLTASSSNAIGSVQLVVRPQHEKKGECRHMNRRSHVLNLSSHSCQGSIIEGRGVQVVHRISLCLTVTAAAGS
ncbi:hypothetical protein JZ751_010242 [Albula glossodonta]|uniref:Uncharacterized protein n=1 Tax=Albula glossodonta TaxID=121402 RepID=A0A8T2N5C5_9TELE|nr:hypothetical protein JZ751_010242 [Albula glossodonta]